MREFFFFVFQVGFKFEFVNMSYLTFLVKQDEVKRSVNDIKVKVVIVLEK